MSAIDVSSHPRTWVGVSVALISAAAFALANSSASFAYHGGSNPLTDCDNAVVDYEWKLQTLLLAG